MVSKPTGPWRVHVAITPGALGVSTPHHRQGFCSCPLRIRQPCLVPLRLFHYPGNCFGFGVSRVVCFFEPL